MEVHTKAQAHIIVIVAVTVAVALCILFADRALALWLDGRFLGTAVFSSGAYLLRHLDTVMVVGALLAAGCWVWERLRVVPSWVSRYTACSVAAAIALMAALALKYGIGRSQVTPLFLQEHIYTFRPFLGSPEYMAFPSATMSGTGAFLVAFSRGHARRWMVATGIMSVLVLALLVTNDHWLGDIIGGTYLGALVGTESPRRLGGRGLKTDDALRPTGSSDREYA